MPITPHSHKVPFIKNARAQDLAYEVIRSANTASLATLDIASGYPLCTLVNFAADADGSPIFHISNLSLHTRNVMHNNRVSLLVSPSGSGDLPRTVRITLVGRLHPLEDQDGAAKRRYLTYNPSAASYPHAPGFHLLKMTIEATHLIDGAGGPPEVVINRLIDAGLPDDNYAHQLRLPEDYWATQQTVLASILAKRNLATADEITLRAIWADGVLLGFDGKLLFARFKSKAEDAEEALAAVLNFA
ncbi:pyridoxamine 5'-phosphate oxidase family protein [Ensifer sp. YR511]|uniref:pyridoxamine 5'-phosphate oxidase family protein n=1 Tax=Ensifer sp. YR511 TaxID=1855294 RepID=UPI000B7D9C5F|nr:pyridoxamine 5'-phosphate oxidase family protein [Ensifer sp. YR511]